MSLAAAAAVAAHDLAQRRHAILRNFPLVGHGRYLIEKIGPELRQYIVAGNDEERPFSRDQRRWVYASAKLENNYFGFGTDNDIEHTPGYVIVNHKTFGRAVPPSAQHSGQEAWLPCGEGAGRRAQAPARVPPGLGGQHLRDEFRLAVGQRGGGAQPRRRAGRVPAEHR